MRAIQLPPALKPGDRIGVAAPASGFPREAFEQGVAWLRGQGFEVSYRDDIFERDHYCAGTLARRLDELQSLLRDPLVKAVFFARGGYGSTRLLPRLDLSPLARHPKLLVGYSDLTPLLNRVVQQQHLVAFHGPLVAGFFKMRPQTMAHLLHSMTRPDEPPPPLTGPDVQSLRAGRVQAPLVGGSLTMLASTLGTPFEVDVRGKILCLEDVGERPYRLDRMLTQLELAGKLQQAAGIAFGRMVDCEEPGGKTRPLVEIYEQALSDVRVPVLWNLPFGHGPENDVLPLGALAELDADRGTLSLLHPVVS